MKSTLRHDPDASRAVELEHLCENGSANLDTGASFSEEMFTAQLSTLVGYTPIQDPRFNQISFLEISEFSHQIGTSGGGVSQGDDP